MVVRGTTGVAFALVDGGGVGDDWRRVTKHSFSTYITYSTHNSYYTVHSFV